MKIILDIDIKDAGQESKTTKLACSDCKLEGDCSYALYQLSRVIFVTLT